MTRLLLAALVLSALLPLGADADHFGRWRWHKDHVRVEDHTGPELDGYVKILVTNWNAALGGGLVLDYVRMPHRVNCAGLPRDPEGMVTICNYRLDAKPDWVGSGLTDLWVKRTPQDVLKIVGARVTLAADTWNSHGPESGYWWHPLGCHELGHAIGLNHDLDDGKSCMGTQSQTPGWHDRDQVNHAYGGHGDVFAPPIPCCVGLYAWPQLEAGVASERDAPRIASFPGGMDDVVVHERPKRKRR